MPAPSTNRTPVPQPPRAPQLRDRRAVVDRVPAYRRGLVAALSDRDFAVHELDELREPLDAYDAVLMTVRGDDERSDSLVSPRPGRARSRSSPSGRLPPT